MKKYNGVSRGTKYFDGNTLVARNCAKCQIIKHVDEFYKDKSKSHGIGSYCADCALMEWRASFVPRPPRPRVEPKPRTKEQNRSYRESQNKRLTSRSKSDVLKDQKRIRPNGTKKCGSCKQTFVISNFHHNIYSADGLFRYCKTCHHRKNTERIRQKHVKYWTKRNIPIECYVCGGPYEESEHIIPLTLEGPDVLANMLPSCVECNRGVGGKHFRPLREWLSTKYPADEAKIIIDRVAGYGVDPGE